MTFVDVAKLNGLPPATIIAAQIDPLQTEGQQLQKALENAGVKTEYRMYEGTTHEFFGTSAIVDKAAQAQDFAAGRLKEAFQ
ncbi:alpha/beta hydrolase [Larkinella rosea]|uniref:Alpha/beta hydrolase fold-3 domain-containing protein n=1 Tax=Larkinella rosea TaxID=2025312 RepID=A0A3P1BV11_9BACT|nr:alpha/beta hydrolase [Larkinella rosea]RRB04940.1 hypothetical protein EHT25_15900 [Larkinella rosea]